MNIQSHIHSHIHPKGIVYEYLVDNHWYILNIDVSMSATEASEYWDKFHTFE